MPTITPNLWFDDQALEAAEFYVSVFPDSAVRTVSRYPDGAPRAGDVLTVDFVLDGRPFTALNGGPEFTFDEAVSLLVPCADQAEVDHYWDALRADGGTESMCGWLKDRYGLSWQVVPDGMDAILGGADRERASRAMQAMFGMRKLDLAALLAA